MKRIHFLAGFFLLLVGTFPISAQKVKYDRFEDESVVKGDTTFIKEFAMDIAARIIVAGDANNGIDTKNIKRASIEFQMAGAKGAFSGVSSVKSIIDGERAEFPARWAGSRKELMGNILTYDFVFVDLTLEQLRKLSDSQLAEFRIGKYDVVFPEPAKERLKKFLAAVYK